MGLITQTRDAPQARDGISQRYAADNLICLMIIRWGEGDEEGNFCGVKRSKRKEESEAKKKDIDRLNKNK